MQYLYSHTHTRKSSNGNRAHERTTIKRIWNYRVYKNVVMRASEQSDQYIQVLSAAAALKDKSST